MGKSNTIAQESKKNAEFNEFLKQKDAELDSRLKLLTDSVSTSRSAYYSANEWDNSPILTYAKKDWQTTSSWGLDNVITIVKEIGKAISGGNASDLPDGNETPPNKETSEKMKENQPAIKSSIANIEETAISLIAGIMQTFQVVNSVTSTQVVRDLPLGYGLHLFFGMDVAVYSRKEFFKNDFIQQYSMYFTVGYSSDEQLEQTKMDMAQALQIQIEINNRLKVNNAKKYEENGSIAIAESNFDMYTSAETFYTLVNNKLDGSNQELLIQMNDLLDKHFEELKFKRFGMVSKKQILIS